MARRFNFSHPAFHWNASQYNGHQDHQHTFGPPLGKAYFVAEREFSL